MKPIAMKCTQQQFDAIKPKLEQIEGLKFINMENFNNCSYLTNNLCNKINLVSNIGRFDKEKKGRTVFEEWDEQIFLEYCGYKVKVTLDDAYIVKCKTETQADEVVSYIKGKNYEAETFRFIINHKGLLNFYHDDSNLWDYIPYEAAHLPVLTYQEWKQLKENKPMTKQKLTVPATDVLEIHKIACKSWKIKIAQALTKIDKDQNITFTQSEVDEMFKTAIPEQLPVLERIFGKNVKEIDWDRIKTGSKVMIQYTGQHCNGINKINIPEPVDVVFYKTPHFIDNNREFKVEGPNDLYCTFYQDGNYVFFGAHKNTDYITEVIEY